MHTHAHTCTQSHPTAALTYVNGMAPHASEGGTRGTSVKGSSGHGQAKANVHSLRRPVEVLGSVALRRQSPAHTAQVGPVQDQEALPRTHPQPLAKSGQGPCSHVVRMGWAVGSQTEPQSGADTLLPRGQA